MQMIQSCAERPVLIHITGDPDYSLCKIYTSMETYENDYVELDPHNRHRFLRDYCVTILLLIY